jgi:hypothetical protein
MRATISRAEVHALCRMLGADPDNVREIKATPFEVTVTAFLRDDAGKKYADPVSGDMATRTHVVPIVGDASRDTVPMRHPDLPGRVIDVRPRGVGQRAMAGWEIVDPPPDPEPQSKPEAPAEPGASSSPPPRGRRTKKKEEDG